VYFQNLPQQVWLAAMSLACGYAFWRGGRPEKLAALACVTAWAISPLVQDNHNWIDPQWGVGAVDLALLGVFVWLALTTDRVWLLYMSAFQLLQVVIHVAIMVDKGVPAMPYRRGLVIWSYCTLVALAVGVWQVSRHPDP